MKILLRLWEGKPYVWKEAKCENDKYFVDDHYINHIAILAVKDGDGGKWVRCKFCEATIKNDPEEIEKHFVEMEKQRNCLECIQRQFHSRRNSNRTVAQRDDGSFEVTETYTASMRCGYSWHDVNTEEAASGCMFNQHRKQGVIPVGSYLMDHPDLFAKQVTVEALKAKGYEYCRRYGNFFVYDMKLRGTMFAYVNEYGIVDHFEASYRNYSKEFYYSATQDKLFFNSRGAYCEGMPYDWGETKYNAVKKKIKDLYKEETAK